MVSSHKIEPETKALVRLLRVDGGLSIRQIVDRCKISRASVYRCLNGRNSQKNGKSRGRPRLITGRQQRVLDRNVQKLRKEEGNFSCHCLRAESDLQHVSLWTVNRTLKRMGYNLQEARKKGILTSRDQQERVQFACRVKKLFPKGNLLLSRWREFLSQAQSVERSPSTARQSMAKTKRGARVDCEGIPRRIGGESCKNASCYFLWERCHLL